MIIRKAKKEDAFQLIGLLIQLGPKFKMNLNEMEERIAAFERPGHQLMVVEADEAIIGAIAFGCYEYFRRSGSCCHVDALVIDINHRGEGIGKKLISYVEQYARDYGANIIELVTANHRRSIGTHAFYEALGYQDHEDLDYSYFAKDLR